MDAQLLRQARCIAIAGIILLVDGCVIIPTPEHGLGQISDATTKSLRVGETTRAEVLLTLGEPTQSFDDQVFSYEWHVKVGYAGIAIPRPGMPPDVRGGALKRRRFFCIAFGTDDLVTDSTLFEDRFFHNRNEIESAKDQWIYSHRQSDAKP
jgi:outer membrane protein assembly factor BamE (lipoprotein component of BamABCDE complex)